MKLFLASTRKPIELGSIIGKGGEGAVHEVVGVPNQVAKLYSRALDVEKNSKLSIMPRISSAQLQSIAAWPMDLVVDSQGNTKGFVMPKVPSRADAHELYSPKSRANEFPEVDFRFLVHVATNICRAVAVVHNHGHVIGDINHGSVLVGRDGTVILIDCDSMQIGLSGRTFTCDVGVPLFTPPELHNRPFRGLVRTANHDAFGLAVLLFQLLFMGRHPFAGRFLGHGDMPIERAIREFRFPYGADRRANQMETPPYTVSLAAMGSNIAALFEQTFSRVGVSQRPTPQQWIIALESLSKNLKRCVTSAAHYYSEEAPACPWCPIEQATFSRMFGQRVVTAHPTGTATISELWAAIAVIKGPGPAPNLPTNTPPALAARRALRNARKLAGIASTCIGLVACSANNGNVVLTFAGLVVTFLVWPKISDETQSALRQAKVDWETALSNWNRYCSEETFLSARRELEEVRSRLVDLPNERVRRLKKLEQDREHRQREAYLDRFRIDRGKISLVGETRVAMLASYGVETAADVTRQKISAIPGFGETLTKNLLDWRRKHEGNFRFNPNEGVSAADISAMDRELQSLQSSLDIKLRGGPSQLRRLEAEIRQARIRVRPLLEQAWTAIKVAEFNANV